ncbi:ABC transporter permease [Gordonia sp. NPDC003376]
MLVTLVVVYLVIRAGGAGGDTVRAAVFRTRTLDLVTDTARLALTVTVLSVLIGVGLAVGVSRGVARGRPIWVAMLAAPLAIPSYIAGFAWGRLIPGFEGFGAAVLILTMTCYPLVMLPAVAALSGTGRSAEDVARTLGCTPVVAFLRTTGPRIAPAVLGGALLVALYAISDFGGPAVVRYDVFTVGIHNAYNGSVDRSLAAVYACLLAAMAVGLALLERLIRPARSAVITVDRAVVQHDSILAWFVMAGVAGIGVLVPVVALIREIATSRRATPDGRTVLEWVGPLAINTFRLAVVAAAVIVVIAVGVALFLRRPCSRTAHLVEVIVYLGFALPGITVAVALVFFGVRAVPGLYLTTTLLVVAYLILFLPLCLGPLRSELDALPGGVEGASRTLGVGAVGTLLRVTLPATAPALLAGAGLAALSIAKELPATLMLAPIGTRTLATDMWSAVNELHHGQAAVLGLVLIAVSSVPTVVLSTRFLPRGEP